MSRHYSYYLSALIINVVSVGFSFLSQLVISRYFGVVALGVFALYTNYVMILSRFFNYGGQDYLIKNLPRLRLKNQLSCDSEFLGVNLLGLILAMTLMTALVLLIVIAIPVTGELTFFGRPPWFYFLCVATALCLSLLSNVSSYFRSAGAKLPGFVFDRITYQPLFFATLIFCALTSLSLSPYLLWSIYVGFASISALTYFCKQTALPRYGFRQICGCCRKVDYSSMSEFFLTAMLLVAYGRLILPLADNFVTPTELGQISAALVLVSPIAFGSAVLNMIFGPAISIAMASGNKALASFIAWRNTVVCSTLCLSIAAIIYLLSDSILDVMEITSSTEMNSAIFWGLGDAVVVSVAASWLYGSQFLHVQRIVNLSWSVLISFRVGFVWWALMNDANVAGILQASFWGNLIAFIAVAALYTVLRFRIAASDRKNEDGESHK